MESLMTVVGSGLGSTGKFIFFSFDHPDGSGKKTCLFRPNRVWINGKKTNDGDFKFKKGLAKFYKDHLEGKELHADVVMGNMQSSHETLDGLMVYPTFTSRSVWVGDILPPEEERLSVPQPRSGRKLLNKEEFLIKRTRTLRQVVKKHEGKVVLKDASSSSAKSFIDFNGYANRPQLAYFTKDVFFIDGVHADERGFFDWVNNNQRDEIVYFDAIYNLDLTLQGAVDEMRKMPKYANISRSANWKCRAVWIGIEPNQELKEWITKREEFLERSSEQDQKLYECKEGERRRGERKELDRFGGKRTLRGNSNENFKSRKGPPVRSPSPKRQAMVKSVYGRQPWKEYDGFAKRSEEEIHMREVTRVTDEDKAMFGISDQRDKRLKPHHFYRDQRQLDHNKPTQYLDYGSGQEHSSPVLEHSHSSHSSSFSASIPSNLLEPRRVFQQQQQLDSQLEELNAQNVDYGSRQQHPALQPAHQFPFPKPSFSAIPPSSSQPQGQEQPKPVPENPVMSQAKDLLARVMKCSTPEDDNVTSVISSESEILLATFISKTLDCAIDRFNKKKQMMTSNNHRDIRSVAQNQQTSQQSPPFNQSLHREYMQFEKLLPAPSAPNPSFPFPNYNLQQHKFAKYGSLQPTNNDPSLSYYMQ